MLQTEFLPEFSPKPSFYSFAGLQPSAWSDPKPITALWRPNPEQKNFLIRSEKNGSDRLALNNHGLGLLRHSLSGDRLGSYFQS